MDRTRFAYIWTTQVAAPWLENAKVSGNPILRALSAYASVQIWEMLRKEEISLGTAKLVFQEAMAGYLADYHSRGFSL